MADAMEFVIGAEVSCSDGVCGDVIRVVVDPIARAVTHLVVEPKHRSGLGRLVPVDLAESEGNEVRLHCTMAEFDALPNAEETQFLPTVDPTLGFSTNQVWGLPYYGLNVDDDFGVGNAVEPVVYDRVPLGEVEVRRGEQVHATDGPIGKVQGLVIDPRDHHVTHVLLQEGHLWGRKEVMIPITSIASVTDGISLTLTKQEVEDLPEVDVDHPDV